MASLLHPQLHPFEINPQTGEPYLRLAPPLSNIIITPPRLSDVPSKVKAFNDPRVYKWVSSPPWPYLPEHAVQWLTHIIEETDAVWNELVKASVEEPDAAPKIVSTCPVRVIREQKEDGSDVPLGDCGFIRCNFDEILDVDEKRRQSEENEALPVGDPDIIWQIGDYLMPSHHGQGIMTAVIGTLMREWVIPRMGVRHLRPTVFEGNPGSVRVFEKNGFVVTQTVKDAVEVKSKGEFPASLRTIHILEWNAE